MTEHISNLNIEFEDDGSVALEQDCTGNISRIWIHPIQLRYLAEKAGLVETSDPQALRTIARLKRQMLALNERVGHLAYYLANHSDSEHANLDYEQTYTAATADIAAEFCADLVNDHPTPANSAPMQPLHQSPSTPAPTTEKTAPAAEPQASLI